MNKDSLGDRMKRYEDVTRIKLTPRMPTIIRVDGRAFHTYTKSFNKPFDDRIEVAMNYAAEKLISEISGAQLAYIQSDEISVLINDYVRFDTQPWFKKNIQKMVSVAASAATIGFNSQIKHTKDAMFDARAFVLPIEEVCNYFIWRQKDCIRNSVSMLAQSVFSHKELQGKSRKEMMEMLIVANNPWGKLSESRKFGRLRICGQSIKDAPIFSDNRNVINDFLKRIDE
jgi:tRNA(His) 5'-end guanylyltransferase